MSAVAAVITYASTTITVFVDDPYVSAAGKAFLFVLWTYIGLNFLMRRDRVQTVRIEHEYTHSIIIENLTPLVNPFSDERALGFNFQIRNVGPGPIKVRVEEVRVRLGDRTTAGEDKLPEFVLPRMGPKSFITGSFKKEAIKEEVTGTLRVVIHYGNPAEKKYSRKFSFSTNLTITPNDAGPMGFGQDSAVDIDEPL